MAYQGNTKCLRRGRHRWGTFVLPLLGLLAAGCSTKGNISGKVLYQGKPLPGGTVTFFTQDMGAMSSPISPEGNYTIAKVPAGEVKIAVQAVSARSILARSQGSRMGQIAQQAIKSGKVDPEKVDPLMKQMIENERSSPAATGRPVQLPLHYADPEKSGLTYTVSGGEQTHDIELK